MAYSDKVGEEIEKDQTNSIQLATANKYLRDQINENHQFREDISWNKIAESFGMENADNFFGTSEFT